MGYRLWERGQKRREEREVGRAEEPKSRRAEEQKHIAIDFLFGFLICGNLRNLRIKKGCE